MAKTFWGVMRSVCLWVLIVCGGSATGLLYWRALVEPDPDVRFGSFVWAVFWTVVISIVGAFELWGKFLSKAKDTISNMYRTMIQKGSKFWMYTILILLAVGLMSLILHLAVF